MKEDVCPICGSTANPKHKVNGVANRYGICESCWGTIPGYDASRYRNVINGCEKHNYYWFSGNRSKLCPSCIEEAKACVCESCGSDYIEENVAVYDILREDYDPILLCSDCRSNLPGSGNKIFACLEGKGWYKAKSALALCPFCNRQHCNDKFDPEDVKARRMANIVGCTVEEWKAMSAEEKAEANRQACWTESHKAKHAAGMKERMKDPAFKASCIGAAQRWIAENREAFKAITSRIMRENWQRESYRAAKAKNIEEMMKPGICTRCGCDSSTTWPEHPNRVASGMCFGCASEIASEWSSLSNTAYSTDTIIAMMEEKIAAIVGSEEKSAAKVSANFRKLKNWNAELESIWLEVLEENAIPETADNTISVETILKRFEENIESFTSFAQVKEAFGSLKNWRESEDAILRLCALKEIPTTLDVSISADTILERFKQDVASFRSFAEVKAVFGNLKNWNVVESAIVEICKDHNLPNSLSEPYSAEAIVERFLNDVESFESVSAVKEAFGSMRNWEEAKDAIFTLCADRGIPDKVDTAKDAATIEAEFSASKGAAKTISAMLSSFRGLKNFTPELEEKLTAMAVEMGVPLNARESFYQQPLSLIHFENEDAVVTLDEIDAFAGKCGVWAVCCEDGTVLDVCKTIDIGAEMLSVARLFGKIVENPDFVEEKSSSNAGRKRKFANMLEDSNNNLVYKIVKVCESEEEASKVEVQFAHDTEAKYWSPDPYQRSLCSI